jgi:alkane 1-monooxygenase
VCFQFLRIQVYSEHTIGHHRHVATPDDPASADRGETVYSFVPKSALGGYVHAWEVERELLQMKKIPFYSIRNRMFWFTSLPCLLVLSIAYFMNLECCLFFVLQCIVGASFLEVVNYVEHYGLRRSLVRILF